MPRKGSECWKNTFFCLFFEFVSFSGHPHFLVSSFPSISYWGKREASSWAQVWHGHSWIIWSLRGRAPARGEAHWIDGSMSAFPDDVAACCSCYFNAEVRASTRESCVAPSLSALYSVENLAYLSQPSVCTSHYSNGCYQFLDGPKINGLALLKVGLSLQICRTCQNIYSCLLRMCFYWMQLNGNNS